MNYGHELTRTSCKFYENDETINDEDSQESMMIEKNYSRIQGVIIIILILIE